MMVASMAWIARSPETPAAPRGPTRPGSAGPTRAPGPTRPRRPKTARGSRRPCERSGRRLHRIDDARPHMPSLRRRLGSGYPRTAEGDLHRQPVFDKLDLAFPGEPAKPHVEKLVGQLGLLLQLGIVVSPFSSSQRQIRPDRKSTRLNSSHLVIS